MDFRALAREFALQYGVDPDVFLAQIQQESGFNPDAVSGAGAIGIAQIVPRWHPDVDPTDPVASLQYAAQLMRSNLDQFGGDYSLALAAYNAGSGAVQQYGGIPPFPETQQYVASILGASGGGGQPRQLDVASGGDVSFDPNANYDPNNPPPDENPPPGEGDGSLNFDWLGNLLGGIGGAIGGLFGGGGTPTPTGPVPPFDSSLDTVSAHVALPGGTQVTYKSHVDGQDHTAFVPSTASTGTAARTAEAAARANNFFKPDGTPDVEGYLAYEASRHGTAGTAAYKTLSSSAAAAGFYNADGTPDTAGYLDYQTSKRGGTAAGSKIINLGSGRYLEVGANGQITERNFGGAAGAGANPLTPPGLDPTRSSIVAYLQALLHQNDLPYSGIARGTPAAAPAAPAVPAAPAIAPATPAIAATPPSLTPTQPFVSPGIGPLANVPSGGGIVGGQGGLQIPGITPTIFQPPGVNTPFVPPTGSTQTSFTPPVLGQPKDVNQPLAVPRSY